MHLVKQQIEVMDSAHRVNMINCVTGPKPAMLLGTKSDKGHVNLGVFSNVIHIGADPAMIGVLFRPQNERPRDTYLNIKSNGLFTLNHVPAALAENAHKTSARFAPESSEFDECQLTEEYVQDFDVPFVKESAIKIGLSFVEETLIKANNTILVIGQIEHLFIPRDLIDAKGQIDLEQASSTSAVGLNSYYRLHKIAVFPYAKAPDR